MASPSSARISRFIDDDVKYDHTFKLVIIGDENVGKTSLLNRMLIEEDVPSPLFPRMKLPRNAPGDVPSVTNSPFPRMNLPSARNASGEIKYKKDIKIDGKNIKLQIWNDIAAATGDSSGQRRVPETLYKDASGVIVVYDVTNKESFDHIKEFWVQEINKHAPKNVAVMIMSNKSADRERVISTKKGRSFATKQGFQFREISAEKPNESVSEAINRMVKIMIGPVIKDKDFLKAVNKGKGEMTQLNIMFHGPPGVGKTSLKQLVLGLPPLSKQEQNSTDIMENPIRAVTIDRANSFKEISNEELIRLLADTLVDQIRQQQQAESTAPIIPPPAAPEGRWWSTFWKNNHQKKVNETDGSDNLSPPENDNGDFDIDMSTARNIRLLRDELVFADSASTSSSIFKSIWHHLIDSGGQPQFQDMLPMIYRSPSFQIVLMRLTERLNEKPKMRYTVEGENAIEEPEDLPLTNLQCIERACQIAASCDPPSKVLIVGTRKDELGAGADKKIASINEGLKELKERFNDVIVTVPNSKPHEVIFDMNAMATGDERQAYTKKLQNMINEVSSKWAEPKKVLLKWLCFHLDIDKKAQSGVITYKDCLTIGNNLGMKTDSVTKALKYFSKTGLLLYYPNDVPELVLTKVNPLIDRLSLLIRASILSPNVAVQDRCDTFKKRGTFDEAFFNDLFPDTVKQSQCPLDNKYLLDLLLCLKLAVKIGRDEYFLPSALSFYSATCQDSVSPATAVACSHYSMSCGFALRDHKEKKRILPHGFFLTTAIELQKSRFFNVHFRFELRTSDQQYRDRIQFHDSSERTTDVVTLTDNKWWVQVTVTNNSTMPTPKHCQKIRRAVKKAIFMTINPIKDVDKSSVKKVFPCPVEGHNDHYCTLTKDKSQYICSHNNSFTGPATDYDFLCWSGMAFMPGRHHSLSNPRLNHRPLSSIIWSDTKPDEFNLFDLLRPLAPKWESVARKLKIPNDKRETIDMSKDKPEQKLNSVICMWIEIQSPPVTWATVYEVLQQLDRQDIINELVSKHAITQ